MKKILVVFMAVIAITMLFSGSVQAQEEKNYTMAASLHPWGFAIGSYKLNFEYLLGGMHGLMVEGYLNSKTDYLFTGGGLFYRLHFKKSLDSWFISPFVKLLTEKVDGSVTYDSGSGNVTENFAIEASYLSYGINMGRRWIFGDTGVTCTTRIGWGLVNTMSRKYTPAFTDPDNQVFSDAVLDLIAILAYGLDWELSVGYAF